MSKEQCQLKVALLNAQTGVVAQIKLPSPNPGSRSIQDSLNPIFAFANIDATGPSFGRLFLLGDQLAGILNGQLQHATLVDLLKRRVMSNGDSIGD